MKQQVIISLIVCGLLSSCAEQQPAINRVQDNYQKKSFYVGEDLVSIDDDPEFYMRGTVIDVTYGAEQDGLFTSTYAQPVSRIRWEITEKYLNARLAYERIEGTDGKGNKIDGLQKKTSNDGQIVASYQILSHFDIRRSYNPTTGEENNILEENTTDRLWYERDYIRVDWSKNLSTDAYDFDTLSMLGLYGSITYEPLSYLVLDPKDENAPHFDTEQGYFDITTKAFAQPQMVDLSHLGWGIDKFPACMLPPEFSGGSEPTGNCNPVELTLRHSFRKVVDNDFEPFDLDGIRFQAFGAFNFNYRRGYERKYGMVDNKWYRFASRYNIWKRSHYYGNPELMTDEVPCGTGETALGEGGKISNDANRDEDKDGTADECAAVTDALGIGGSQCDIFNKKCTLPYTAREAIIIPWYVNGNLDEDLFEATNWGTMEWNLGMKTAIQVSRLVECRNAGGADCEATYPMWTGQQDDYDDAVNIEREVDFCRRQNGWDNAQCDELIDTLTADLATERGKPGDANVAAIAAIIKMQPVFMLCHNPVIEADHPACGEPGLAPRLGDLRYNTVLHIDKPQTPSAWGIMVDADDPITGEKVAASINIWTHITDLAVQQLVDLVRYMHGEIKTEEITNGDYIHDAVQANRLLGGLGTTMHKHEVDHRLAAGAHLDAKHFTSLTKKGLDPQIKKVIAQAERQIKDIAVHADAPSVKQIEANTRLQQARGTPAEAALINPAMLQLAGIKGNLPMSGPILEAASPLGLNNPKFRSWLRQAKENALAKRGACILYEAPEASSLTGIADILKKKFPVASGESDEQRVKRVEAMHRYLRRKYHYAVISHEMGHSVGHRHNFVSSFGSMFFRPQYWQLRTKNGTVKDICTDAVSDGSKCVGPRYYDPISSEEQDQMIWMFMQSSAMDYPGDVSQDMIGLGIWDFSGARFFYGDTVAVYRDEDLKAGSKLGVGITNVTDTFGGLMGIKYAVQGEVQGEKRPLDIHYSQLQNEYGLIKDCRTVTPMQPSWWSEEKDGKWDPLMDGHIVKIDGKFTKCRQRPVDYTSWKQLQQPNEQQIGGGFYRGGPSVDPKGRLRVPYHFATDHWADLGNVSVFRHDNGADPYEQAMFLITTQENRHILDNFRRGRSSFSIRGAASRSFSRYNEKLVNIAGGIAFYSRIYEKFASNTGYTFNTIWPFIVNENVRDQMIAGSLAFDHLTRQLTRPEDGPHFRMDSVFKDPVLRSAKDPDGVEGDTKVVIPNGATGFLRDVGFGGHPIENALSEENGDFDTQYNMNAGGYYDKINTIIHLSLSEDRFISQSRGDFYDARMRANGMADLFPEGYRRIIANALTNDRSVMAPHLVADEKGDPMTTAATDAHANPYPVRPIGWTSWWPDEGPSICFPTDGKNVCSAFGELDFKPEMPQNITAVDPQIGWEVQKFIIAWVLAYIPANQQSDRLDMMKVYRLGPESSPLFEGRIEFQDPISGQIYYARTYGKESMPVGNGKTMKEVQKGIAARVLEYANELISKSYKLDYQGCKESTNFPAGFSEHGRPCYVLQPDGSPIVLTDMAMRTITPEGMVGLPPLTCDLNLNPSCTPLAVSDNHYALELKNYKSVIDYLWEVLITYKLGTPNELGYY